MYAHFLYPPLRVHPYFLVLCVLGLEATAQVMPSFELGKKKALKMIRKTHPSICVAKDGWYISPMYFQQELFALDKKYTVAWVDSIDNKNSKVRVQPALLPAFQSKCKHNLYFSNRLLNNFILCEAISKGNRTFIVTEVYLFQIKGNRLRLISKKEVNYN